MVTCGHFGKKYLLKFLFLFDDYSAKHIKLAKNNIIYSIEKVYNKKGHTVYHTLVLILLKLCMVNQMEFLEMQIVRVEEAAKPEV